MYKNPSDQTVPLTSNEITISGKKLEGANATKCNYSTTFQAVLHQIKKLDCASSNISKLSEIQMQGDIPNNGGYEFDRFGRPIKIKDEDNSKQRGPNLIVNQNTPFKIGKNYAWVAFLLLFDLLQKTIFKPFFAINDKKTIKVP